MAIESEPYGAQLLAEFQKLRRMDLITAKLDYQAVQVLKQADRSATLKLFQGSSYAFLQLIKTKDPAEVAQALVQTEQVNGAAPVAAMIIMAVSK
jgi:hypothetical protein